MPLTPREAHNVTAVGYHDLAGRPGFKIALQVVDGRWYCYLGHFWHSGWTVLDVTDPTDPTLERFVPGPPNTTTKQVQVADGTMLTSLERPRRGGPIDGPTMDPGEPYEAGAYLWDVSTDPTDPERVGHYDAGGRGTHRNFYAGGDYAYMCASPAGYEPAIDDPETNPAINQFLVVLDVSDPANPTEVGRWLRPEQAPPHDPDAVEPYYFHGPAYVRDDTAYLSYGRAGAVALDVSDPTDPTLRSRLDVGGGVGAFIGVHSFVPLPGTVLAVANSEAISERTPLDPSGDPVAFAYVVDLSDDGPSRWAGTRHRGPRVVATLPTPTPDPGLPYDSYYEKAGRFGPHNQHHPRDDGTRLRTGELLFMTYFNAGLRIFDLSDPLVPTEVGYFVPEDPTERISETRPSDGLGAQFEDVAVDARGYIYCTEPQRGLSIYTTDLLDRP